MGGNTRTVSFPTDEQGLVSKSLDFDPCAHPGGSDLPGTKATFESTLYDGDTVVETVVHLTTLGPDTARPAVTLNADPPTGSRVEPGDVIHFDVTAQEARSGLSWQKGVRELRVKAVPGEDLVPQVRAASSTAKPCNRKQWSLVTQEEYTVPEDPPESFKICPIAIDFAGNQNADTCATYFTREVWEGPVSGTFVQPSCTTSSFSGKVKMAVADDGTVTGSGTTITSAYTCDNGASIPRMSHTYTFSGTATDGTFTLHFTDGSQDVTLSPIAEDQVQGTVVDAAGGYVSTVTLTLDCLNCEDVA